MIRNLKKSPELWESGLFKKTTYKPAMNTSKKYDTNIEGLSYLSKLLTLYFLRENRKNVLS